MMNNGRIYYTHPIHTNFAASADGYMINNKTMNPTKGYLTENGYYMGTNGLAHRFIFEAVNQTIIPPKMQVNHIDSNRQNNSIENL